MTFVFLATSWGTRFGGVNAFNADLASSVAKALPNARIVCVVASGNPADVASADGSGIILLGLEIDPEARLDGLLSADVAAVLAALRQRGIDHVDVFVGHDVLTGEVAIAAGRDSRAKIALIHHMSYISYHGYKSGSSVEAFARHREQQELFGTSGATLFAVGPVLTLTAKEAARREDVTMLIPGLADVPVNAFKTERLIGVTFGRFDGPNERLKNGRLAVAAFADAYRALSENQYQFAGDPRMYVIGAAEKDERNLAELAAQYARRPVNIISVPFIENRDALFSILDEATLAFMLSKHDGFGLAGWESMSACVPLILSKATGLYSLLYAEYLDGFVEGVDIVGSVYGQGGVDEPNRDDVTAVSMAVQRVAHRLQRNLGRSKKLKELLSKYSWSATASTFLSALNVPSKRAEASLLATANFIQTTYTPATAAQLAILTLAKLAVAAEWWLQMTPVRGAEEDLILGHSNGRHQVAIVAAARDRFDGNVVKQLASRDRNHQRIVPLISLLVAERFAPSALVEMQRDNAPFAWYDTDRVFGNQAARELLPFLLPAEVA